MPELPAEMPVDTMIPSGGDLAPTGPEELSLEALFNTDISIASKSLMKQSEAPSIVTVITRPMLQALGSRSVAEALRDVPGFFLVDDGVTSNIAVRGVNAGPNSWSRIIKVMVDGHPVTDYSTGGTFLGPELIPIEVVESIEIIRGAGSALYGANAFLGVINIVTRKPKEQGAYLEAGGEAGTTHGNLGGSGHALGSVTIGDNPLSYLLVSARHDQLDRSGLRVPASSPSLQDFAGRSSQGDLSRPTSVFIKGVFDLGGLGNLATQYQLQRLDAMAEFSDLSILSHDNRIARSNNILGADHTLSYFRDALVVHTSGTYTDTQDLPAQTLDSGDTLSTYRRERANRTYQVGTEVSYRYKRHSALLGVDYMSTSDTGDTLYQVVRQAANVQNAGNQILFSPGHPMSIGNAGVFGQIILRPHRKVGITAGMRYDWNDRFGNSFNPRLALVVQPLPSIYIKGLYGTSFVPPTPVQLYAVPLRFDGGVLGNDQLKNQRARTAELQVGYKSKDALDVAVNGFYTLIDDRIEFEAVGNQMRATNLNTSHSYGMELSSSINRQPIFARVGASYQFTKSDVPSPTPLWWERLYAPGGPGGERSLDFPALMGSATVGVTLPRYHLQSAVTVRAVSSRKASAANSYVAGTTYLLDPYYLVDLNVSTLELRPFGRRLSTLSLHVNNVLGRSYSEPGYLGADLPSMGAAIFLKLTQELGGGPREHGD
jgi:iron complex outermembrane receptor protein